MEGVALIQVVLRRGFVGHHGVYREILLQWTIGEFVLHFVRCVEAHHHQD